MLLWEVWEAHARKNPDREAIVHWDALGTPVRWTYGSLLEKAGRHAEQMLDAGIDRGDVCAIILRHNPEFYPIYLGVSAIGALPAVLAYPNARLHPAKFAHGLEGMSQHSGLDWILTDRELAPIVEPLVTSAGTSIRGLVFPLDWKLDGDANGSRPAEKRSALSDSDPLLLQHSSGTTGLQKPVVLSHRAVLEHVHNYAAAIALQAEDKVVSWLPLYHDMGLIAAFHLPLAFGIASVQIDPFQWVTAPGLLFDVLHQERGTLCWLPNFAYNLLADRVHDEDLEGIDLSSVRLLVNCSEPIRAESHERFLKRFAGAGIRETALGTSYAMAEATFAVTQSAPGSVPPVITIGARRCVSSGRLIAGCEVKIVDDAGNVAGDDVVGEIVLTSVSLFDGYRNYPEKTALVLKDGWFYSGDLGFTRGGELYVIARKKDLIISAGKNLYPEDIEDVVGQVRGVIPGRVIAFAIDDPADGTEQVAVVAETEAEGAAERNGLRLAVKQAAMAIDVTVAAVYLVPPRWLIKSSAGKPSRKDNRERLLRGEAGPAALEES